MRINIAIIDYGMGNLRSVVNAFNVLGHSPVIVKDPGDIRKADRIVLPGVGAFGDAMRNLRDAGWVEVMEEEVLGKEKPFLGICLGMQLLATFGTEHGKCSGLNWIPGKVIRLGEGKPGLRVPHIGWNDVRVIKKEGLYAGLPDPQSFYFLHSYVLVPDDKDIVSGICDYEGDFVASIKLKNISAIQFHPEKSHKAGLKVLMNFLSGN
ncbi:MAG: imidazole glycerol phosphate synthase subunit HisH [Candidatus Omnitrophica bacterium]|nr:imidazole glycerol phosphate synthase subunit HisH [Candidatus Omnitrophota bacterium]